MSVRRLAIIAVVLAVSIFGIELGLSVLRQRTIDVVVRVEGPPSSVASEAVAGNATPMPGEPASAVGSLLVSPPGIVIVDVAWRYRIGPRFPVTTLRAEISDGAGVVVASDELTITCETAGSLQCDGDQPLTLRFGSLDAGAGGDTASLWPVGEYTLRVTRAFAGISPATLVNRPVIVAE
ncbi:MAG: hypothetical protein IT323_10230 [Anaerolineae bacterium]|nr:hypothetical protein [Anaerolineae bacterium]